MRQVPRMAQCSSPQLQGRPPAMPGWVVPICPSLQAKTQRGSASLPQLVVASPCIQFERPVEFSDLSLAT